MDIQGLQKMTLLDWPGKVACTVFLGGCDFRCPFCHNAELLEGDLPAALTQGELLDFLRRRRGLLDGVCVTGGEPLLRADLAGLLEEVKALGYPVKVDTNGSHPARMVELWERGLVDYVAMDVKNEYITAEQAKADYGVIVDPESFDVVGLTPEREAAK